MFRLLWGSAAVILLGGGLIALQATASSSTQPPSSAKSPGGADLGIPAPTDAEGAPATGQPPEQGIQTAVVSSLIKIRPATKPEGTDRLSFRALRGECESAQIALGGSSTQAQVRRAAVVGDLGGGVDVRLSRVDLVELKRPSGPEGEVGLWPDPLIPAVDVYVQEARKAFPFSIPAGESRSIWLDVCVSGKAAPGRTEAVVAIDLGGPSKQIPLSVEVLPQEIPATATLPTSFGFSALRAALGHYGRKGAPDEVLALDRMYRMALLRSRISVHGGTMEPPPFRRVGGELELDFRGYDLEVGPFLEGTALGSGAKATTAELRTHPGLSSDTEKIAYWRAIAQHHRKKGWKAILFDYAKDEPKREDLPGIATRARLVKKADQAIQVLVTASHDGSLADLVDLWTPNLNCLYVKKRPDEFCPWRAPIASYRKGKGKLWWYQSCSSHGCGEDGPQGGTAEYFRGWPSYVVDAPGSRARAMGWLAFAEGIDGELYWDTIYAYSPDGSVADPFAPGALWAFGGNGDGTFFYPGVPARIGGKSHIPLDSIRLAHIRDGLEDYELLRMVAALPGGSALARKVVADVAPAPYRVADDAAPLEGGRRQLLDFLQKAGARAPTPRK